MTKTQLELNKQMNKAEIAEKAKDLEERAEGNPNEVAKELHSMSNDDRKAIVDKIKADQNERKADELPTLEFYDSNNLKKVTDRDEAAGTRAGSVEENTYEDASGNRTSRTIRTDDNYYGKTEYDPKTGKYTSEEVTHTDKSRIRVEDRGQDRDRAVWYDAGGRVVSTAEDIDVAKGQKVNRDFGYDKDGQLNRIEGVLGHWERQTNDKGQVYWHNTDRNINWEGDFSVDTKGNLHYDSHKGQDYTFTPDGKTIKV